MDYESWEEEVRNLLEERYGITPGDCTEPQFMRASYNGGDTPEQFVDDIGERHALDRLDAAPWG